ncbi:lipid A-modifier LpxR family protein [Brevundimonas vesicularis]|uniref:lipid A-modifier LpxR family protein n=1 Tax=Brevundimonas vesicularis TaxID=41276 RepID=UPI0038D3930E
MRLHACLVSLILATPAVAVAQVDWRVAQARPVDLSTALPDQISLIPHSEVRFSGPGFHDRLRVSVRDNFSTDALNQPWTLQSDPADRDLDVSYRRDWVAATGRTASGLEVSLTPHAGLGTQDGNPLAEAGATLRIGQGLDRLVSDGRETFGERPRWYLYAAGSKRAVGYNFARTRDGDFARSGVSHDNGAFIGDASIGVAYRKGPVHTSFGLAYREIEAKGLRSYHGLTTDVAEGLVAFQLSIRP